MATTNDTQTTQNNTSWYNSDAAQNLLLQLLQRYERGQQGDDAQAILDQQGAGINASRDLVNASRPQGMDFSRYMPLLDAIGSRDFTKEAAITDSQGFINQIFRDFENTSLPKIYENPRATGIFNDTSTQLLANDAFSSAVAKGQSQLVQNILAYSQARQAQLNPVIALMNGQVSNSNALMTANNQHLAAQLGLNNQQNALGTAQGTLNSQQGAANRRDNAALLGNLWAMYQQSQQQQQTGGNNNTNTQPVNVDTGSGGGGTYTGGSVSAGGGTYADDYYDLGGY